MCNITLVGFWGSIDNFGIFYIRDITRGSHTIFEICFNLFFIFTFFIYKSKDD